MHRFVAENSGCVAAIGLFEGIFFPLVMLGAARLPGAMVQVLNQSLVPATVAFSAILLRRRYNAGQLLGVGLVMAGVFAGSAPSQLAGGMSSVTTGCLNASAAIVIGAYCCLAMAVTLKEVALLRWKERALSGKAQQPLGMSLLCARAALAQFTLQLTLWIATASGTIHGRVHMLFEGIKALLGFHEPLAPGLTLLYWASNIGFTFAALRLVRQASAATVVLANVIALPLSALVFCWKVPLLPPQQFHWNFAFGLALVVVAQLERGLVFT
jgi:drug/metabolite transporter (DMT)-like permease